MSIQVGVLDAEAIPERTRPLPPYVPAAMIQIMDVAAVIGCGIAAYWIYLGAALPDLFGFYAGSSIAGGLTGGMALQLVGCYRPNYLLLPERRIGRAIVGWLLACGALLAIAFLLRLETDHSRVWTSSWFLGAAGLLIVNRVVLRRAITRLSSTGSFGYRTVIYGAGLLGRQVAQHLREHPSAGSRIIGFVDDRSERVQQDSAGPALLGDFNTLIRLAQEDKVDQVIIALPWHAEARIEEIVQRLGCLPIHVLLAPDAIALRYAGCRIRQMASLGMLQLGERPLSGERAILKAVEDRILGAMLLLAAVLPMILIGLLIRLDSPGPVFFRQRRIGYNNRLITVWKFRTMHTHLADATAERLTAPNDDRVTRVGRFLRKTSLDEVPQLINVVLGSMSLVGPRPHATAAKAAGLLYHDAVEYYAARHKVKPGITGWAQVNGWRGETDTVRKIEKRVEHDLFYIRNWSLKLDLLILIKTFLVFLKDENAY